MSFIKTIIEPYIELERAIRERMSMLVSSACGMCTACCCRADICEEVTQSAFLSRLLEHQGRSTEDMDDRFGWLDVNGCSLEYGRPPICYAFFCDELLAAYPDDESRWALRILGRLMDYVGDGAAQGNHLVDPGTAEGLDSVDVESVGERLEQAQTAFGIVEHFFESGQLNASNRAALEKIPLEEL